MEGQAADLEGPGVRHEQEEQRQAAEPDGAETSTRSARPQLSPT